MRSLFKVRFCPRWERASKAIQITSWLTSSSNNSRVANLERLQETSLGDLQVAQPSEPLGPQQGQGNLLSNETPDATIIDAK